MKTLVPINFVNGVVDLPGSKSISNRVLLLSSISYGQTILTNLLNSDDTKYMIKVLKKLKIKYKFSNNFTCCKIFGQNKILIIKNKEELFLGNAGTVMRPLTAMFSLRDNDVILTGDKRMQERPIGHLVDALIQGGANIQYLKIASYPPVRIKGGFQGGKIILDGSISSQFLSSLLMMTPLAPLNTQIIIKNKLVSKPYIDVTINLMKKFKVEVKNYNYSRFDISSNQKYISPKNFHIESDASSASYFLAAAAIKGGTVKVKGINANSIQGDIKFAHVLEKMGAKITWGKNFISCTRNELNGIDLDMNHIPDAAMTIATTSLFAKGTTTLRNIFNWRVKETDRLSAMSNELKKVGAIIKEGKDYIKITPPLEIKHAEIETYNDHRMAMCFSLLSLSKNSVTILNSKCVSKTFPNYFKYLQKIAVK